MIKIALFNDVVDLNTKEMIRSIEMKEMYTILILDTIDANQNEFDFTEFDAYIFMNYFKDQKIIETIRFESTKGKPVIGIGNGAKVLIEHDLIKGLKGKVFIEDNPDFFPLLPDESTDLINVINCSVKRNPYNVCIDEEDILIMQMQNASTRFNFSEINIKKSLEKNHQIMFKYCDDYGNITKEEDNNNNIASIISKKGNVLAIMPCLHARDNIESDKEEDSSNLIFESIKIYLQELNEKRNKKIEK